MKILIAGIPKAGKTTLTETMKGTIWHTDDLMDLYKWSEVSQYIADTWIPGEWDVIEGVAIPRALRKWLAANPEGKPCDKLIWMDKAKIEINNRQIGMGKGCFKVMNEIVTELISRGVEIEYK